MRNSRQVACDRMHVDGFPAGLFALAFEVSQRVFRFANVVEVCSIAVTRNLFPDFRRR